MKQRPILLIIIAALFLVGPIVTSSTNAAEWPSKPISIVVGWTAGGSTDLVTRMLAEDVSRTLRVPVVIENKPGASGVLSLSEVSKNTKPDGYTLVSLPGYSITTRPHLKQTPYDPINGFTIICSAFRYAYGIVVKSDAPWKTFRDFVNDVKNQPGKLSMGYSGAGSLGQLAILNLERQIPGFKVKAVPYQGGMQVITALLGGHIHSCIQTPEWRPYVEAGQMKLIAVPQLKRMKDYPDIQTLIEMGINVYMENNGMYATAYGLTEDIRSTLESAFKKAMKYDKFLDTCKKFSLIPDFMSGKEAYAQIVKEYNENKALIPQLGIKVD